MNQPAGGVDIAEAYPPMFASCAFLHPCCAACVPKISLPTLQPFYSAMMPSPLTLMLPDSLICCPPPPQPCPLVLPCYTPTPRAPPNVARPLFLPLLPPSLPVTSTLPASPFVLPPYPLRCPKKLPDLQSPAHCQPHHLCCPPPRQHCPLLMPPSPPVTSALPASPKPVTNCTRLGGAPAASRAALITRP